jgi:hypothetical protein
MSKLERTNKKIDKEGASMDESKKLLIDLEGRLNQRFDTIEGRLDTIEGIVGQMRDRLLGPPYD